MKKYPILLSIAGSDPSGGAGIQCDIKTASSFGVYAMAVVTTITCQSTIGVAACHPVSISVICDQLKTLLSDIRPDAVKIGMLPSAECVYEISDILNSFDIKNIIVDPVLSPTSGESAIKDMPDIINAYNSRLFPLATLITPNIPEFLTLSSDSDSFNNNLSKKNINDYMERFSINSMLLKGGHFPLGNKILIDYLYLKSGSLEFPHRRLQTGNTHGTGCALSSAIASCLALGMPLEKSVERGIKWLEDALEAGADYVLGKGCGPINFFCK